MCIVAIAHLASSRYPLIVAANRDERHLRDTAPALWWSGEGSLLAGRDLEAGGTWLGVTGTGRFAAVTNIFVGLREAGARSRGALVTEFLQGSATPAEFAAAVERNAMQYGPFNLLLRDGAALEFVSNRHPMESLGPGIHVFSNNAPGLEWNKVAVLGGKIRAAIDRDDIVDYLIESLSGPAARGSLEQAADSIFVVGDDFGTRCTTVLTVDADGRARFVEQRFESGGVAGGRSEFEFKVAEPVSD